MMMLLLTSIELGHLNQKFCMNILYEFNKREEQENC